MILPTKHIPESHSLLGVGATVLALLNEHQEGTVSSVWDLFRQARGEDYQVPFDWFVLALDLLYMLDTITIENGVMKKKSG